MAKPPPVSKDVQEFQFRLQSKLKIFEYENDSIFYNATNLVTVSSRFGLVFAGTPHSSFQVIKLRDIELFTIKEGETHDYACRNINLPSKPSHLKVNCDDTFLSVVVEDKNCAVAIIYKVVSFFSQNIIKAAELRLSSKPGVKVLHTCWNPTIPGLYTVCKDDGSLSLYELKETGIELHELPNDAKATSMCWSPKGKQLVVGAQDGKLIQYKPDLKAVKAIDAPLLGIPHSVLTVQWLSNYQFAAVFQPTDKSNSGVLLIIDAPKVGSVIYTNFEDICYSYSNAQASQFYLEHMTSWGALLVASSNSIEVGVLGGETECWKQWIQDDSNRCELPLGSDRQDTLPVGLAIATGTTLTLKKDFKSEDTIPPAPLLLILSNHGLLCSFSIVNLLPGIPQICSPPEPVMDQSGLNLFTKQAVAPAPQVNKIIPNINPTPQPPPQHFLKAQLQNVSQPVVQRVQDPAPPSTLFSQLTNQDALFKNTTANVPVPNLAMTKVTSASPMTKTTIDSSKTQENTVTGAQIKTSLIKSDSEENLAHKNARIILLNNSIKEECVNFQAELREVLEQSRIIKVDLGTDQEHIAMIQLADNLTKFQMELRDTTTSQAAEIHYLKQSLMQAFAWCEDARSRHLRFSDPGLNSLMRAQELDPVNQARLADLHHLLYYLESQLRQVDNTLDEQWSLFQDSLKKTIKIQIPTLETVYQSMVRQNAILMKQSFVLKDISSRLKTPNNNKKTHTPLITSIRKGVVDVITDLRNLQIEPADAMQGKYDRVVAREQRLNLQKQEKLRDFFLHRNVTHISTSKPCLSSSVLNMTPNRSMKKMQSVFSSTAMSTSNAKKNLFQDISTVDNSVVEGPLSPVPKSFTLPQSTPKQSQSHQFKPVMQQENVPKMISTVKNIIPSQPMPIFGNTKAPVFVTSSQPSLFQQPASFGTTVTQKPAPVATTASVFKFSTPNSTISSTPQISFLPKQPALLKSDNVTTITPVTMQPTVSSETKTNSPFSFGPSKPAVIKSESITPASISIFKVTEAPKPFSSAVAPLSTSTDAIKTTPETKPLFANAPTTISMFKSNTQSPPVFGTSSISSGGSAFAPLSGGIFGSASSNSIFSGGKSPGTMFSNIPPTAGNEPVSTSVTPSSIQPTFMTGQTGQTPTTAKPSQFTLSSNFTSAATTTTTSLSPSSTSPLSSSATILNIPSATSLSTNVTSPKALSSSNVESSSSDNALIFGASQPHLPPAAITPITSKGIIASIDTGKLVDSGESVIPSQISISSSSSPAIPIVTTSSPFSFASPSYAPAPSSTPQDNTAIFSSQAATDKPTVTTSSQATLFGLPQITPDSKPTSAPPAFGSSTIVATTTASTPIFAEMPAGTNIFASTGNSATENTTKPVFGSLTTSGAAQNFEAVTISPASTQSNVFGAAKADSVFGTPSKTAPSNVFGTAITTSSAPDNAFENKATIVSTSSNIFGGSASISSSAPSNVFGSATSPAPTNVFGNAATAPSSAPSNIFGGSPGTFGNTTSSAGSIFAQDANKAPFGSGGSSGSIFGGAPAFGTPTSSTSPLFGSSTFNSPSPGGSIFGGASQTAATSTSNIFAAPVSSSTTFGSSSSIFATKPTDTASSAFGFGTSNNGKTEGSFSFGNLSVTALSPNATPASTSPSAFGAFSQNPFAKSTSATTFMGQNVCTPFGGGGGGSTTSSGSIFGAPVTTTASSSVFGGTPSSGFGSSPAAGFGSPPSSFGGGSIFAQPTFGQQQSGFGSPPAFGASPGSSAFGATPQSPQQTPGNFSMGNQTVGQTGFGGFQKPATGFGAAPVFGSSSPGGFGNSPSFGGAPSFGSPPKVFGATSPQPPAFGSPTQENTMFANLANQNTVGFGSLAQTQKNNAPSSFSGNSSFSSWR